MALRWIIAGALLAAPSVVVAQAQPTLEQRVQRMEDESAIRRMLIEYGKFLDAKDYHAYAALFAPDGVWQGGFGTFTGPAAIEAMLTANLGAPEAGFVNKANFHMLTNPLIALDGTPCSSATSSYSSSRMPAVELIVIDVVTLSSGRSARRWRMSSIESIATPTLPTSPSARG